MKVTTFTVLAGTRACPNRCAFCISKMTPDNGMMTSTGIRWDLFRKACEVAINYKVENFLITGKGEPTLYPEHIIQYLHEVSGMPFASRELQTEGSVLARGDLYDNFLRSWKLLGLDIVSVSIFHYLDERNKEILDPKISADHYTIRGLITKLHTLGLLVRLSCVLIKGYIDSIDELNNLIDFAKDCGVHQLTIREMGYVNNTSNVVAKQNAIDNEAIDIEIVNFLRTSNTLQSILPHGAEIYNIRGQNVCYTTCMDGDTEAVKRNLIFYPNGKLATSWSEDTDIL